MIILELPCHGIGIDVQTGQKGELFIGEFVILVAFDVF
jgi:hypothetical protein